MNSKSATAPLKIIVNASVIALCISLSLSMFITGWPQKIFYVVSYVSFFTTLYAIYKKDISFKNEHFYLVMFFSLFFLAAVRFVWAMMLKHNGIDPSPTSAGIINNYLVGSKRILLGAFVILCLSVYGSLTTQKTIFLSKVIIVLGLIVTLGFGLHEHFYTVNDRIKLTTDASSMSSYMIIFIYAAYLGLSRLENHRYSKCVDLGAFILTFILLYLCGTRITILALIFLKLTFIFLEYKIDLRKNWQMAGLVVLAIVAILGITGHRWAQGINDIQKYDVQSSTSLGARVAIWESGIYLLHHHIGFTTPDERTTLARAFIKTHHPENTEGYTNVQYNMHNEFLEVTTLQGLLGTFSLLLPYLVLIYGWVRKVNIKGMVLPFIALFVTGLTDSVILYDQTATLFVMSLAVCCIGIRKSAE